MATLVIAANLPDLDALGLLVGENLAWRRGWTHGPIAMMVLPPLLVSAMLAFDRWQARSGTRPASRPPVHVGWLFALAYIGWASHPLLDLLNTYGIRLLMPFSDRWFYGDTLFIIDVWIWSALGLGVWLSRRRRRSGSTRANRPAMVGLSIASLYTIAMGISSLAAEHLTREVADARGHGPITTVVASPVPLNPFRREVVFATDKAYGFGVLNWLPLPELQLDTTLTATHMDDPAIAEARAVKPMADFLYWSRLPFARIERGVDGTTVTIADARYTDRSMTGPFVRTLHLPPKPLADQMNGTTSRP